jgi:hypothetical protein
MSLSIGVALLFHRVFLKMSPQIGRTRGEDNLHSTKMTFAGCA